MYSKTLLSLKMKTSLLIIVSLPLFGLTFAIVWSLLFDFESSTATHCKVKNYLPSVSAAIGRTPQAYVWRACISLHSMPRYAFALMKWNWLKIRKVDPTSMLFPLYTPLCFLCVVANFIELTGLLGLTVISSLENADLHEGCFIIFMVGAITCMISMCLLNRMTILENDADIISARRKAVSCVINITSFCFALYFYFRHLNYCEPGVYSLFALCEYIVILSNMSFHVNLGWDLAKHTWIVCDGDGNKLR